MVDAFDSTHPEDFCQPVYEATPDSATGQRLVLTAWMLLDELTQCQEQIGQVLQHIDATGVGQERCCGIPYNPMAIGLERAYFNVSHVLRLLWRSGLWTEDGVVERADALGRLYSVIEAPFTDGKPSGRPLPDNAPRWQRELLGVPTAPAEKDDIVARSATTRHFRNALRPSEKKAA